MYTVMRNGRSEMRNIVRITVYLSIILILVPLVQLVNCSVLIADNNESVKVIEFLPNNCKVVIQTGDYIAELSGDRNGEYCSATLDIYRMNYPNTKIVFKGGGYGDLELFIHIKDIELIEDENYIILKLLGDKPHLLNFTSYIKFYKNIPGALRITVEGNFYGAPVLIFGVPFKIVNGSISYPLKTVTYFKYPIIININNNAGRIFSIAYMDLNGKDGIYNLPGFKYVFYQEGDGFGWKVPMMLTSPKGRLVVADAILYLWAGGLNDLESFMLFLKEITEDEFSGEVNYSENMKYINNMIDTVLHPPDPNDIYMKNSKLFKAYVGDRERTSLWDSEFISQVNVLLGAAYLYNRTQDEEAKRLISQIMQATLNFDVYFVGKYGIYSNNYGGAGRLDSWYQVTNPSMLLLAHDYAPNLIKINLTKHKMNADWLIGYAHKVGYKFPIFVYPNYKTEGNLESDAGLGYAYYMVKTYKLTGNTTYLNEASVAIKVYINELYGQLYEAHLVPMGIAAASYLYKFTNDTKYLKYRDKLIWVELKWLYLHRGNVINKKTLYVLVSAMPHIYTAAFEYGLTRIFLEEAYRVHSDLKMEGLYTFYTICAMVAAKYAFPQIIGIHHKDIDLDGDGIVNGIIDDKYWVPIEDIYPVGYEQVGKIPQEIYGFGSQLIALMPPLGEFIGAHKAIIVNNKIVEVKSNGSIANLHYTKGFGLKFETSGTFEEKTYFVILVIPKELVKDYVKIYVGGKEVEAKIDETNNKLNVYIEVDRNPHAIQVIWGKNVEANQTIETTTQTTASTQSSGGFDFIIVLILLIVIIIVGGLIAHILGKRS